MTVPEGAVAPRPSLGVNAAGPDPAVCRSPREQRLPAHIPASQAPTTRVFGMSAPPRKAQAHGMPQPKPTHLFTENGALCGAWGDSFSLAASTVTCPACRALAEVREYERRESGSRREVVELARVLARMNFA